MHLKSMHLPFTYYPITPKKKRKNIKKERKKKKKIMLHKK
jgi:hypothetical protein